MSESFDDALDRAIDALHRGEQFDRVLARHPRHADALRPLLETLQQARRAAPETTAMSPRLTDHFSIVRAAVQRAQMPRQASPARDAGRQPSWWQRRLTFASLSVPAGAFALLAFAGVSGAAASIAVTGDVPVPSAVVDLVKKPQHWLPGTSGSDHGNASNNRQQHAADDGASASASVGTATETAGSENRPSLTTLAGTISDIHGDVFTLTTVDGIYKVNIDGTTKITGSITDGGKATITGSVTAGKNMHADIVIAADTGSPTAPGANDATPTPGSDKTPGSPADRTPGAPADHTPGTQPEKTTAPPATPSVQSGGAPNGNVNGNSSGGGPQ